MKRKPKKSTTSIRINNSVQGDTIELIMERLMEGEGDAGIEDRDLVYNDKEAQDVNPITNIRSDRFELMLEEKIGEYEHKRAKVQKLLDEPKPQEEIAEE